MLKTIELPRDPSAPALARRAAESTLREVRADGSEVNAAELKLLLTELVTNSVVHGEGDTVRVILDVDRRGRIRCEVVDSGTGFAPIARAADRTESGGWGLMLVEQMSERWGVSEGSTHVWFELAPAGPASAER